jgi:predicted metal-dependent hydrolase
VLFDLPPFLRRPAAQPSTIQVIVDGRPVSIAVRRHASARRLTLRVRIARGDVVMTLPARVSLKAAQAFAERQVPWIGERLRGLSGAVPFADGAELPVRGVMHRIAPAGTRAVTRLADPDDGGSPLLLVGGSPDHLPRRTLDFLKREAKRDLEAAVARHASALGVTTARITIKDTRSRWGSCSSQGALAFSWRLVMAPPMVLDYVAAHEVAHRREMNHSPRFWAIVLDLFPQTDAAEAWLKAHGAGLHRYGTAEL